MSARCREIGAFALVALLAGGPLPAAEAPGPPAGWRLAFSEAFDSLDTSVMAPGRFAFAYPDGWRTNRGNRELEYYVDPRPDREMVPLAGANPFSVTDGVLTIRAWPLSVPERRAAQGLSYASGMLTTHGSFAFRYGYAEIRARMPRGKGLWPAFWLLARAGGWPPEIDVLEVYGDRTTTLDVTLHTNEGGRHRQEQRKVPVPDLSEAFHTYAVTWTSESIVWSFDGAPVFAAATPADLHQPMFLLLNLAVGGTWTGSPDATTSFPAQLEIDRIRVFVPPGEAEEARR
ncbi:hypothetical protein ASG52_19345 [Methylobacterium sp. Leaf456]|uniref:glycoside hydrolase family 16 protein n=1 Tax=Methylobacterium sp. Leaf456 TaxID=1736382 RepID=UPI0006F6B64A|nr:glycoside hydrolase family 16 protein [Methylobacterium sp. Leaf456]KQT59896.1 hypothetical protein ASG52_19345 [Methylobacterium sp. Leaf456]